MTPKEKAKELIERFEEHSKIFDPYGENHAKQCALICVDEMLEATKKKIIKLDRSSTREIYQYSTYWKQVKKEIEKL